MSQFKINNIVNEEAEKIVRQATILNDEKLHFQQRLNNSEFLNYDSFTAEFDSKITASDIIVTWGISFWLNKSGVQKFIIDVEKVEGQFNLMMLDKHTDEQKQETLKNISEFDWKFIIDQAAMLQKDGSLYISLLKFDFKNQNCIVTL